MTDPAKPRMRDGLIKRGDWWYFVLDERRDPATGKRRQKWVKGGRSRDEAKRARNAARTKHDQGGWRAPGALTVSRTSKTAGWPRWRTRSRRPPW